MGVAACAVHARGTAVSLFKVRRARSRCRCAFDLPIGNRPVLTLTLRTPGRSSICSGIGSLASVRAFPNIIFSSFAVTGAVFSFLPFPAVPYAAFDFTHTFKHLPGTLNNVFYQVNNENEIDNFFLLTSRCALTSLPKQ